MIKKIQFAAWLYILNTALLLYSTSGLAACSVSASGVAYGGYIAASPLPTDGVGTVTVGCSGTISLLVGYDILLSAGSSGSYSVREMYNGPDSLQYNLYTDLLRTSIWGDGTGGSDSLGGSILIQLLVTIYNTHTVYGRIFPGQYVSGGLYADTITVTVNY